MAKLFSRTYDSPFRAALVLRSKSEVPSSRRVARSLVLALFGVGCLLAAGCDERSGSLGPPIITLTPKAVTSLQQAIQDQNKKVPLYLRVRVLPGGCMGFQHKLDLDPAVSEQDYVFAASGLKIVVLKRQIDMLRGAEVDFGMDGDRQGFKIQNPNFEGEAAKKWLAVLEREPRAD